MHTLLSVHPGTGVLRIWGQIPLATFWLHPSQAVLFYALLRLRLNSLWANNWLSIVWKA